MPLVSIIVPVYNTEKYLDRCINSLQNQTLKDIEIILVDDGSTDNSGKICDQYRNCDSRIKVVHKVNGGLSSARNAGLYRANGQAIAFVDSDDSVDLRAYEILWDTLKEKKVDFVMCDYMRINDNETSFLKTTNLREGYFGENDIRKEIYPQLIMGENLDYGPLLSACTCLYRSSFLKKNKIHFDEEVRWSEDNIFSAIIGYKAESFYYLKSKGLYHYYNNPGTITNSYRRESWNVYCIMNKHIRNFFETVDDFDFSRQIKLHQIYYACNCLNKLHIADISMKEKKKIRHSILYSEQLKESFKNFVFPRWPWKLKLKVYMIKYKIGWILDVI